MMKSGKIVLLIFLTAMLNSMSLLTYGQDPTDSLPPDPGAIYVFPSQELRFGASTQTGTGGTITIGTDGTRTVGGSVIGLNLGIMYYQAIIDVECPPGSLISITNGPDALLTGSNGGNATLHIGNSDPGSPFSTSIAPPGRTHVNIGGTLTVGNPSASPPGVYSGTFSVTFNYE